MITQSQLQPGTRIPGTCSSPCWEEGMDWPYKPLRRSLTATPSHRNDPNGNEKVKTLTGAGCCRCCLNSPQNPAACPRSRPGFSPLGPTAAPALGRGKGVTGARGTGAGLPWSGHSPPAPLQGLRAGRWSCCLGTPGAAPRSPTGLCRSCRARGAAAALEGSPALGLA